MPPNEAAYLTGFKVRPLKVNQAPYTSPGDHEIVLKNRAVAINPLDWVLQDVGTTLLFQWIRYPFVLGADVAGEVVEVGPKVSRFKLGDRVLGHAVGTEKRFNTSAQGAFQLYTVMQEHMSTPMPSNLPYENACVIPLALSTAAVGLYQKDQLALQLPTLNPSKTGKTVLIWGGSTSVGCNAIQLAVASGYEVFATASPRNFELLKRLGAAQVFDYNSKTVVADIVRALQDKTVGGALAIRHEAAEACLDVLNQCNGEKAIALATYPLLLPQPKRLALLQSALNFISWNIRHWITSKARGIRTKFIWGASLLDNEVGPAIYEKFLPQALANGSFVAAPDPHVVGKGLEHMQAALDLQKKGVSATKVVVCL
ncbi:MAG: hypothetical protein LQ338_001395 [Usnochroma carphineum]|nr:MAG: hypothetical protein LQ338_001395 [Usnochroma carphineum]